MENGQQVTETDASPPVDNNESQAPKEASNEVDDELEELLDSKISKQLILYVTNQAIYLILNIYLFSRCT